jgi:PD-(D/E)XK nuclease superfamily
MPKYFSVSDMMTFLACRERWDLSSPNRQSLRHKASPRLYLTTGTAFHHAIEGNEKHPTVNPVAHATAYLAEERSKRVAAYKAETGFEPWPAEMKKFEDAAELTTALVDQYFDHYGTENPLADQGLRYIATEVPFKIPIDDLVHLDDAYFVGTFDGIAADDDDNLWLVENKTYTQKPDVQDLMVHFQTTGYAVAWEMLTGLPLTGALYNGVAKKLIKEPRRLQSGALSTDVSQQTTLARYTSAMLSDGLSIDPPPEKYVKILQKLTDIDHEGDSRFFYREKFFFNKTQLENWFEEFIVIAQEMTDNPRIYRTVPYNGCGPQGADCWYRDLCFAKHTGQDVDELITKRYEQDAYGTIQAVDGIDSVMVSSIQELREALKSHG